MAEKERAEAADPEENERDPGGGKGAAKHPNFRGAFMDVEVCASSSPTASFCWCMLAISIDTLASRCFRHCLMQGVCFFSGAMPACTNARVSWPGCRGIDPAAVRAAAQSTMNHAHAG